ncbi:metallophosphoesterase [bacterium]|nr:metallophosphoesterase [bacterium]
MLIALFGDVHGNLPAVYSLCEEHESSTGEKIDLALQIGDMELWRNADEMKAADPKRRHADEFFLGAAPYVSGEKPVPIPTWFVHGNNENYALLREVRDGAIDPAGRLVFLPPGCVREFHKDRDTITISGLGGMEYRFGKFPIPNEQPVHKYIYPPAIDELERTKPAIDILLLHDAPMNKGLRDKFPTGSKRITRLIETISPRFAFYGHYDNPPEPFRIGNTLCACLNLPSARRIPHRDGSMAILRTNPWQFEFLH